MLQELLEKICGLNPLTDSLRKQCEMFIDYYVVTHFNELLDLLKSSLDAASICHLLPFCSGVEGSSTDDAAVVRFENVVLHLPANMVFAPSPDDTELVASTIKSVECRLCRMVLGIIQKEIDKPEYEHSIVKLLGKVCSLVPPSDREKCSQFVEEYADVLIKILADQTDPGIVCQMLDLCPDQAREIDLCPVCQSVMHFLEEELEKPADQRKVEDVVRKVCRYVPDREKDNCELFITNYASVITSILSEELDPSLVCPILKLCPQQVAPLVRCRHCQHLMGSLTSALGDNRSEQEVISTLEALVPPKNPDLIVTAVQLKVIHLETIVDMMGAELNAAESCVLLKFCDAKMISAAATDDIAEVLDEKLSCELCELMVQLYVNKLASSSTVEIEADLQIICDKIKNPEFSSHCTYFVHKYVPQVVKLLKEGAEAVEMCSLIKLCPFKLQSVAAGYNRCEFCEAVVGSLDDESLDPTMMSESIEYALELCAVFGESSERNECLKVISYVGPQLESVALGIPSWYYCTKIDYCPYGAHRYYKQVCQDPTQWCRDATTMLLCDQLSYCQKSEWMSDEP